MQLWIVPRRRRLATAGLCVALLAAGSATAGPLLDRLAQRRAQTAAEEAEDDAAAIALPDGVRVLRELAYGSDPRQRIDVYLPAAAPLRPARVIFMVHGGAWRVGDKAAAAVVANKLAYWLPRGYVLVSANYRLLPAAPPLQQARDVAAALARAQALAPQWGADGGGFVLMGHSAGAHLVALLAAAPELAREAGARPWLGTVTLDSAALDVVGVMEASHPRFYDRAFGSDAGGWRAVSPAHRLREAPAPLLLVCSSRRREPCPEAQRFAQQVAGVGGRAEVLPQALSHGDINKLLGEQGPYTAAVDNFIAGLAPAGR